MHNHLCSQTASTILQIKSCMSKPNAYCFHHSPTSSAGPGFTNHWTVTHHGEEIDQNAILTFQLPAEGYIKDLFRAWWEVVGGNVEGE